MRRDHQKKHSVSTRAQDIVDAHGPGWSLNLDRQRGLQGRPCWPRADYDRNHGPLVTLRARLGPIHLPGRSQSNLNHRPFQNAAKLTKA